MQGEIITEHSNGKCHVFWYSLYLFEVIKFGGFFIPPFFSRFPVVFFSIMLRRPKPLLDRPTNHFILSRSELLKDDIKLCSIVFRSGFEPMTY